MDITSYDKSKMEDLANQVESIKQEYSKIINELDAKVTEIHSYWHDDNTGGATYQTFRDKFTKIKPHLEDGTRYMERFKNVIVDQKDDYKKAEDQIVGNLY